MQVSIRSSRSEESEGSPGFAQSSESGKSIHLVLQYFESHQPFRTDPPTTHRSKKCIPSSPRCVRCMELGIEDCRYDSAKRRGPGNTLRTGQACVSCRRVASGLLSERAKLM